MTDTGQLPRLQTAPLEGRGVAPRPRAFGHYIPSLDGVRAFAILGVIAYHLGFGWAAGGYLGVDLFFVLSGFLITGLLVEERAGSGTIRLAGFWARRARRLLPGLILMLGLLCVWVEFTKSGASIDLQQLRGDALSTLFYVANWHLLFAHQSYFQQFSSPSPLQHTWSLAIEEQFYLLWPLALVAIFSWNRSRTSPRSARSPRHGLAAEGWRRSGMTVALVGCIASAGLMAALASVGVNVNRLYYGTDTRAFDLLAGAALAMYVAARPEPGPRSRRYLHASSPVAVGVLAICWWRAGSAGGTGGPPMWMLEGGFLACAAAAAVVIADVRQTSRGPISRLLELAPLRWIGRISYGLYLWHWPVIVEVTQARTGLTGLSLDLARVAIMFGLATLSFYLVERPLRRASFRRLPGVARVSLVPTALVATCIVVLGATLPVAAMSKSPSVSVGASSAVPGAGGFEGQRPIELSSRPTHSDPLQVMLIGDSVMNVQSPALEAALDATGVVQVTNRSFPGWGLSTDTTWRTDVPRTISELRPGPQIVIAMWSWDSQWVLSDPTGYRKALEAFVRVVLSPGDGVEGILFEQYPVVGPNMGDVNPGAARSQEKSRNAGLEAWSRMVSGLPRLFPGRVMYFPVGSAVTLEGQYTSWLPPPSSPKAPKSKWVRVRMTDNTHFCPAGAARYSDAVLEDMTTLFDLPAAAGWSTGPWADDPLYYHQSGLSSSPCPDDHPSG